jgi:hypothetical protein
MPAGEAGSPRGPTGRHPFVPAIGAHQAVLSAQAIGGDLYQTIYREHRWHYLSREGRLKQCAVEALGRRGWGDWIVEGSVILDVEVEGGWLHVRGARRIPDVQSTPWAADDDYWSCYDRGVRTMSFSCNGCKPGKHQLEVLLHRSVLGGDGSPLIWDDKAPKPATDTKFRIDPSSE